MMGAVVGAVGVLASCGGSDSGLLDCAAYIDKQIECGIIPAENAAALRDTNIRICNNWENTYKEPVVAAIDACTEVACDQVQSCAVEANQLCQADVSASIDSLCEKVVECGWEELTNDELCQEALLRNQGLYMCLRPDVMTDYVDCVRDIACGPESEDAWYGCGFELQSR